MIETELYEKYFLQSGIPGIKSVHNEQHAKCWLNLKALTDIEDTLTAVVVQRRNCNRFLLCVSINERKMLQYYEHPIL